MTDLIREIRAIEAKLGDEELKAIRDALTAAVDALQLATRWVLEIVGRDPQAAMAASVSYLMLVGYVLRGGWQMGACRIGLQM